MTWKIRQGDALELLREVPEGFASVFIMDPPYARSGAMHTGRKSAQGRSDDAAGSDQFWLYWFADVARQVARVTIECGLTFCDWRTAHLVARAFDQVQDWDATQVLIWDRDSTGMGDPFRASHEMIVFARRRGFKWAGSRSLRNVIKCRWPYGAHRNHPAEKPVALMRQLIEWTTAKGNQILDPFAGSGSIGVAAVEAERQYLGLEMNEDYCEIARRRCRDAQPSLFTQNEPKGTQ